MTALASRPGLAVDDRGHPRDQLDARRARGEVPERRVRLEHLVLGRAEVPDLPDVVHHADPVETDVLRGGRDALEIARELGRPARPGEVTDVQAELHALLPSTAMHSTLARGRETQTSVIWTSMLPRVAFEYGQNWCAAATSCSASAGVQPGRCTSSAAVRPSPPDSIAADADRRRHGGTFGVQLQLAARDLDRRVKARRVAGREKQLRVRAATGATHLDGHPHLQAERAVLGLDLAVAAVTAGVGDGGVQGCHG